MPAPEPFALRMQRLMYGHPLRFGVVMGVGIGLVLTVVLGTPIALAGPVGWFQWRLVVGVAVLAGAGTTGLVTLVALRIAPRPPSWHVSATRFREARRLLRTGEGSTDPWTAELVVMLAERMSRGLKWQLLSLTLTGVGLLCTGVSLLLVVDPGGPVLLVVLGAVVLALALLSTAGALIAVQTRRARSARERCLPHLGAGR